MLVYHFTDTAHLPWILQAGELRPGANRIGGFPDPDFLWATTNERGSRRAVGNHPQFYHAGKSQLVRFTLNAADFEPWREIVRRYPAWTPVQIEMLERAGGEPPTLWHCRVAPLPRSHWMEIATKPYTRSTWRALPTDVVSAPCGDGFLGIIVDQRLYASRRIDQGAGQPTAYDVRV